MESQSKIEWKVAVFSLEAETPPFKIARMNECFVQAYAERILQQKLLQNFVADK